MPQLYQDAEDEARVGLINRPAEKIICAKTTGLPLCMRADVGDARLDIKRYAKSRL
jgi:hypothetical protein